MLLRIDHETKLSYTEPVIESVLEVKMSPLSSEDQTVMGYKLKVTPMTPPTSYRDGFGNRTDLFNILPPHKEVVMRASSCVRVHRRSLERLRNLPIPTSTASLEEIEFVKPSPLTKSTSELREFARSLPKLEGNLVNGVDRIMEAIRDKMKYEKRVTNANTPVGEALKLGQGVCQDFAHLFIAVCHIHRLAARYVSGYVNEEGELATHAWSQIWGGPQAGWIDVDPTRGKWVENNHVVTAIGRDYSDVSPNRGVWKGGTVEETIAVSVKVAEVDQVPPDLMELTSPAWTQTMSSGFSSQRQRSGFSQQNRRQNYRQQQSQQQQ